MDPAIQAIVRLEMCRGQKKKMLWLHTTADVETWALRRNSAPGTVGSCLLLSSFLIFSPSHTSFNALTRLFHHCTEGETRFPPKPQGKDMTLSANVQDEMPFFLSPPPSLNWHIRSQNKVFYHHCILECVHLRWKISDNPLSIGMQLSL